MIITVSGVPDEIADLVLALQGRQSTNDTDRIQEMFNQITEGAKEIHASDEPLQF